MILRRAGLFNPKTLATNGLVYTAGDTFGGNLLLKKTSVTYSRFSTSLDCVSNHFLSFCTGMPTHMAEAAAGAAGAAAPAAKVEEKTSFDVKLDAFDAASKLKLIKEIRGLVDGLGLKEAKALVESSPVMVKEGLTKDEAETLKAKLEAVGGTVLLE